MVVNVFYEHLTTFFGNIYLTINNLIDRSRMYLANISIKKKVDNMFEKY